MHLSHYAGDLEHPKKGNNLSRDEPAQTGDEHVESTTGMAHQIREVDASEGRGEPPSAEDDEPAKSATGDAFPTAVEVQAPECEGLQDEPVGSSTPIVVQASECEDPQVLSKDGSIAEEPAPAEAESESEEIESEEETPGAQQAESAHTLGVLLELELSRKLTPSIAGFGRQDIGRQTR